MINCIFIKGFNIKGFKNGVCSECIANHYRIFSEFIDNLEIFGDFFFKSESHRYVGKQLG